MALLLIASAAVVVAAVLVGLRLPSRGTVSLVGAVLLLAQAMIVTTIGFSGLVLRSLQGTTLVLLALAWLLAAIVVPVLLKSAPLRARERASEAVRRVLPVLKEPAVALALLLVLATLAWRTFLALRLPVVDYDGWSYHLVFVDVWLQNDALVNVTQRPWTQGYPAVQELVTTWLAAFTRTDALTGFTSILPIPMAIAATSGLARSMGADRRAAALAGLLLGMVPAIVVEAGTSYVDAAAVATVVATWWLGLRFIAGDRDGSAALLLGIAGGLALGTKGSTPVLVAPVLAVAGLIAVRDLAERGAFRSVSGGPWGRLALLTVPILVLGGSWYFKNLAVYGNPFHPFAVGPFDTGIQMSRLTWYPPSLQDAGQVGAVVKSWLADWTIGQYDYNVRPGGLGRAWLPMLAVGGVGLIILLRHRRWAVVTLVVLPAAVSLLVAPNPWYARYTLFLPALGAVLSAVTITAIRPRSRAAATILGLVLVTLSAWSLLYANTRPNIDVRAAFDGVQRAPGPLNYLGYVLDPSDERRMQVSLRDECAGFGVIPPGSRVMPAGFNLLHGVVGPSLDRILTDPPLEVTDAEALAASAQAAGADWIVTNIDTRNDRLAASAPDRFESHGRVCGTAALWKVLPAGDS